MLTLPGLGLWAFFFLVLRLVDPLLPHLARLRAGSGPSLEFGVQVLKDLRETLASGQLPVAEDWHQVSEIPAPWGALSQESLHELRESGLPVLPTLERLETLLREQVTARSDARARSAQSWAQAVVSACLVPIVSVMLYFLFPGVSELGLTWWLVSAVALILSVTAMVWMLRMCDQARWADLKKKDRAAWPAALCFGERLLSSLRAGIPADLAWVRALPTLSGHAPKLALAWGTEFWAGAPLAPTPVFPLSTTFQHFEQWGIQLREGMQKSVIEGRPCGEKLEASLMALKQEWSARVERELGLLATRALKPLFLLVAPGILSLMAFAFLGAVQL
jgi:hypothetical protein